MGAQWESVLIIQLSAHCDPFSRFHPYQDGQVPRKHLNNRKGKTWGFQRGTFKLLVYLKYFFLMM